LPTPTVSDNRGASRGEVEQGNPRKRLKVEVELLPTPKALDGIKGNTQTSEHRKAKGFYIDLPNVAIDLMPTTRVSMANGPTRKEIAEGNPKSRIEVEVMLGEINWGKFKAAIERWENVVGRPAPAPTKPDGKDNGHRLSSLFTEWLMGLPEGWITGLGLRRNDELKLAGNGVVPQQAELALRILLEDDNLLERIKK
jgi:DNA (cytosine-5)-methyltransferase 1